MDAVRLMRLKEVRELTSLSRSVLYRLMAEGAFPRAVKIDGKSIAWHSDKIADWIATRPQVQTQTLPPG